jgi:hypothetical protein
VLGAVASSGALAAAFVLGAVWERGRRPPPTSTYRVILTVDEPGSTP